VLGGGYGQAGPPQAGYGKPPGPSGYEGSGGYGVQGDYGSDGSGYGPRGGTGIARSGHILLYSRHVP